MAWIWEIILMGRQARADPIVDTAIWRDRVADRHTCRTKRRAHLGTIIAAVIRLTGREPAAMPVARQFQEGMGVGQLRAAGTASGHGS